MLVGASVLFYINIDSIIGGISDKNEIAVFVNENTSDERIAAIEQELSAIKGVSSVTFDSKEEAFKRMMESMPDYQKIFESLGEDNPLPDGFRVKVNDIERAVDISSEIRLMPDIYYVGVSQEFVSILM
jgi:cell division transport system permease protein